MSEPRDRVEEILARLRAPIGGAVRSKVILTLAEADVLLDELGRVRTERDAYRRAKVENDERFQLATQEARQERDQALADLAAAREEAKGLREEIARLPWMIGKTLPNFARIPGAIVLSSFPQIATILAALGREGGE